MRPLMAKSLRRLAFGLPLLAASLAAAAEPLTKEQLLALVNEGVDTKVIVALVRKDCVSFPIDAGATLQLAKLIPADVLAAAIDCQSARAPQPEPAPSAPLPPQASTPTAKPQSPARVRVSASRDASDESGYSLGAPGSCKLVVDYTGPVKALKGAGGYDPDPAFRDDFPGANVHELPVPHYADRRGKQWVELSPGPHTISLFCRTSWTRNDVTLPAEPGVDYRILVAYGIGGVVRIVGAEPDR